jgi:cysteine desulfurase
MTLLCNGRTYLDWNASSVISDPVKEIIIELMGQVGNPSSIHLEGRKARIIVETARDEIQELLGLKNGKLIFTSGATEAAGLILHNKKLKCAPIEHECVKKWCEASVFVKKDGQIEFKKDDRARVLQFANSETGILQNQISNLYCMDAVQAIEKMECNFEEINPKAIIMASHKVCGPKGVGAAFLEDDQDVLPLMKGGQQEYGLRAGTENFILIAAFSEALKYSLKILADGVWEKVKELRDYMEAEILNIENSTKIIGLSSNRLPNTSCIVSPGWKSENQVISLDLEGFSVSSGSACSSGKVADSASLTAMGYDKKIVQSALRVSLGPETKKSDIESFIFTWKRLYKRSRFNKKSGIYAKRL